MTHDDLAILFWLSMFVVASTVVLVCLHTLATHVAHAEDVRALAAEARRIRDAYEERKRARQPIMVVDAIPASELDAPPPAGTIGDDAGSHRAAA